MAGVLGIHGLYINTKKFPDAKLRQAMNMVINRTDIFNQVYEREFEANNRAASGSTPCGSSSRRSVAIIPRCRSS